MTPDDQDPKRSGPRPSVAPVEHPTVVRSRSSRTSETRRGSYRILIEGRYDARPRS